MILLILAGILVLVGIWDNKETKNILIFISDQAETQQAKGFRSYMGLRGII